MAALETIVLSLAPADERTWQLLLTSLCLVVALLVAAVVVALVNRWRRQRDAKEALSPDAQLAHFRSLCEAGTISPEEFERLRAVLSARLKESLGVSQPPPAPPPPETGIQRPDGPHPPLPPEGGGEGGGNRPP